MRSLGMTPALCCDLQCVGLLAVAAWGRSCPRCRSVLFGPLSSGMSAHLIGSCNPAYRLTANFYLPGLSAVFNCGPLLSPSSLSEAALMLCGRWPVIRLCLFHSCIFNMCVIIVYVRALQARVGLAVRCGAPFTETLLLSCPVVSVSKMKFTHIWSWL